MEIKQTIKPKPDCEFCHGDGEVFDSVPYGSTSTLLPSLCECVEAQANEDDEIVLDVTDEVMYQIVLDILVGEYTHYDYRYYLGTYEGANQYANSELKEYWGEGETYYDDIGDWYMNSEQTMSAQLEYIEPFPNLPVMTAKGAFHFQPTGWRIE